MSSKERESGQSSQASFPFPPVRKGFSELKITPSNEAAIRAIRRREHWPMPVLCLLGPPQCGLTALAEAWSREAGGQYFATQTFGALRETELEDMASQAIAIDAADKIADEGLLLTLLNLLVEKEGRLLLTSHTPPPLWRVQSADLASRLKAMLVAEIDAPDEATLKTRLKAAARRHYLRLEPDVLSYVAPRLGRTYSDVEDFVVKLSEAVSQTGRAPSVHLARAVLEETTIRDLYDE